MDPSKKALGLFHLFEVIYLKNTDYCLFGLPLFKAKQVNLVIKCAMVACGVINLVGRYC